MPDPVTPITNEQLALEVIKATTAVQDAHDTVVEEGKRLIAHVDDPNAHGRDVDATAEAAAKAAVDTHDTAGDPHTGKFAAEGHDHQIIAGKAATAILADTATLAATATLAVTATLAETATRAESAALADAVPWAGVSDKPADYQPAAHVHTFADLDEKPESFPPAVHGHGWGEVAGKPASYPPVSHSHPASEISDVIPVAKGGTGRTDGKAVALASSRTISLSGDVTGSGSFDGSGNVNIYTGASASLKISMAERFFFGHF